MTKRQKNIFLFAVVAVAVFALAKRKKMENTFTTIYFKVCRDNGFAGVNSVHKQNKKHQIVVVCKKEGKL